MSRYVADTGYLRSAELAVYLSESTENFVALAEYTCMECYQGDSLTNIERSLEHLRARPGQVLILRWAIELIGDQDRLGSDWTEDGLIELGQTRAFPQFCRDVEAACRGNAALVSQIRAHGVAATQQLDKMRGGASQVAAGILGIAHKLDRDRLKRLRKDEPLTASDIEWFLGVLKQLADLLYSSHPHANGWPGPDALRSSWLFRYALSGCLLMRWWIQHGGLETAGKKLGNDMIDMTIATFATYFDGLLTKDNKLADIHAEMCWVLKEGLKF